MREKPVNYTYPKGDKKLHKMVALATAMYALSSFSLIQALPLLKSVNNSSIALKLGHFMTRYNVIRIHFAIFVNPAGQD